MAQDEQQLDDKAFEEAFGAAAAAAEKGEDPPVVDDKPAADQKTPEQIAAESAAAEVAEKAAADKKAAEDAAAAQAEADKAKTPEQLAADTKAAEEAAAKAVADQKAADERGAADAKAAEEKQKAEQAEADKKAAAEQKAKDEKARQEFEESLKDYEPTAEEAAAMAKFKEDFPTEHAVMETRLKATDRVINQRVYNAVQVVLQQVYKDLEPVAKGFGELTAERHVSAITKVHADYAAVQPLLGDWIKAQSAFDRPALEAAYKGGDAAAVTELVSRYKASKATVVAKPAAEAKPALSAADVADLEPVKSQRATPSNKGAPDPNDYDGAFAEAAAGAVKK